MKRYPIAITILLMVCCCTTLNALVFDFSKTMVTINELDDNKRKVYDILNNNANEVTSLLESLLYVTEDSVINRNNDILISNIAMYADGELAETIGSTIISAINKKPRFITNISQEYSFEFSIIHLYYEILLEKPDCYSLPL